jgi:hypothetical protein
LFAKRRPRSTHVKPVRQKRKPSKKRVREPVTAWHPLLVALLETYLPEGWKLIPEFLLNRLPQRVDIVVLRLVHEAAAAVGKLHSIFDSLRPHTLIEHKGPTDELEAGDALTLLGYAAQYMRLCNLSDPGELCLMVICDRIPAGFVDQVERQRGRFAAIGGGLWRGEIAGFLLHGVETSDAYRASPSEHLLYSFSRAFVTNAAGFPPLDEEEREVYTLIYQQVEQYRRRRGDMAIKDREALKRSYDQAMAEYLDGLSTKELANILSPDKLAKLVTSDKAKGLDAGLRVARAAVRDLCEVLDIRLTREREAALAQMQSAELDALRERLKRERRWE